jgi:hypothetical protein
MAVIDLNKYRQQVNDTDELTKYDEDLLWEYLEELTKHEMIIITKPDGKLRIQTIKIHRFQIKPEEF